jgi:hypothetical protein
MKRGGATRVNAKNIVVIILLPIPGSILRTARTMLVMPQLAAIGISITIHQPLPCVTTAVQPRQHGKPVTRTPRSLLAAHATTNLGDLPLRLIVMIVPLTTLITSPCLLRREMQLTLLDPTVVQLNAGVPHILDLDIPPLHLLFAAMITTEPGKQCVVADINPC